MAQKGQPHASLMMSSSVTSAFSNLCLSNLWHYTELAATALILTHLSFCWKKPWFGVLCVNHLEKPEFWRFHFVRPTTILSSSSCRQYEGAADEGLAGAELLLQKQEEEVQRLQAHLASRLSRASLYPTDDPLAPSHVSMLDLRDPLYPHRKPKVWDDALNYMNLCELWG